MTLDELRDLRRRFIDHPMTAVLDHEHHVRPTMRAQSFGDDRVDRRERAVGAASSFSMATSPRLEHCTVGPRIFRVRKVVLRLRYYFVELGQPNSTPSRNFFERACVARRPE
jgi:hypothetical protein